jgi:predicted small lipoprotein YifL
MAGEIGGFEVLEMTRRSIPSVALAATFLFTVYTLSGCGQTGELYLPDQPRAVVTPPAQTAPATPPATPPATTAAPNSPQTLDTPPAADTPATEVTAPVVEKKDPNKNEKGAAAPSR